MNRFKFPTIIAITLSFLICSVLLISSLLSPKPQSQQPLITVLHGAETKEIDLLYELKKAEIIPTVLDEFHPVLTISIEWDSAEASYGNTISVSDTQDSPTVKLLDQTPTIWPAHDHPQLTLVVTDPDAPSRDDPKNSEFCHWIATAIPLTSPDQDDGEKNVDALDLEEVVPYRPPGPPETTGKHRYVFVALAPLNGTKEKLHLRAPGERARWGHEHERKGVREWAEEMGLGVVGANFIYEQNEVQ